MERNKWNLVGVPDGGIGKMIPGFGHVVINDDLKDETIDALVELGYNEYFQLKSNNNHGEKSADQQTGGATPSEGDDALVPSDYPGTREYVTPDDSGAGEPAAGTSAAGGAPPGSEFDSATSGRDSADTRGADDPSADSGSATDGAASGNGGRAGGADPGEIPKAARKPAGGKRGTR